jgi:hypothetical protein
MKEKEEKTKTQNKHKRKKVLKTNYKNGIETNETRK